MDNIAKTVVSYFFSIEIKDVFTIKNFLSIHLEIRIKGHSANCRKLMKCNAMFWFKGTVPDYNLPSTKYSTNWNSYKNRFFNILSNIDILVRPPHSRIIQPTKRIRYTTYFENLRFNKESSYKCKRIMNTQDEILK